MVPRLMRTSDSKIADFIAFYNPNGFTCPQPFTGRWPPTTGGSMSSNNLYRIRSIANYQFGRSAGKALFPDNVNVRLSHRTGRVRHIYYEDELLATLRPTDGLFSLGIQGARRLLKLKPHRLWVKILDDAKDFVSSGRSVFAKHVIDCDQEIRTGEEVVVLDDNNRLLATGRAALSGEEMKTFNQGVAIRVRRGVAEKRKRSVNKVRLGSVGSV
jgi:predicted RNA-binding protein (TIGR00451 family)